MDEAPPLGAGEGPTPRVEHCVDIFEDFCVVSEAVRAGTPVQVTVSPTSAGTDRGTEGSAPE